jgi:hypothetical protein
MRYADSCANFKRASLAFKKRTIQPTVSRWENAPTLKEIVGLTYALIDSSGSRSPHAARRLSRSASLRSSCRKLAHKGRGTKPLDPGSATSSAFTAFLLETAREVPFVGISGRCPVAAPMQSDRRHQPPRPDA